VLADLLIGGGIVREAHDGRRPEAIREIQGKGNQA